MADKLQGKPADRAAEKSIIDPSVSASHSTRHLRNPPTTRPIFGAFRHVRVIRRRARHICIEDSFRQSKVGKGERERWNGSRATGKTMPSVLHDVPRRAIVSLPEKRELDALVEWWKIDEKLHSARRFWNFFLESPLPQQRIREENVGTRFESK